MQDLHAQIAAWPDQAVFTDKSQLFGRHRPAQGVVSTGNPAGKLCKTHFLELVVEFQAHLGQVQVSGAASPFAVANV